MRIGRGNATTLRTGWQRLLHELMCHILRSQLNSRKSCVSLCEFPTDSKHFENKTGKCLMTKYWCTSLNGCDSPLLPCVWTAHFHMADCISAWSLPHSTCRYCFIAVLNRECTVTNVLKDLPSIIYICSPHVKVLLKYFTWFTNGKFRSFNERKASCSLSLKPRALTLLVLTFYSTSSQEGL
jgi:hypothetical protein